MRIFLLPISTRRALIYCQRLNERPISELGLVQRTINRVPRTWAKWETAESGWKKTLTEYGNRALQRIPYQEWGLKSFPPLNDQLQAEELCDNKKFDMIFPANIVRPGDVPKIMRRLAGERKQLHWRRFMWSLIGIPFTIPFGLVPILPNIPFFYLAFRCYSHWRGVYLRHDDDSKLTFTALKGSDHLEFLLENRLFRPISTPQIESVYNTSAPSLLHSFTFVTRSQVLSGSDPEESMLLKHGAHKLVAKTLEVPELAAEVERAIGQVEESRKWQRQQAEAPSKEEDEKRR